MFVGYFYLGIAIFMEILATNLLKSTEEFTRLFPSLFCITAYTICFYSLAKAMRYLPLNVAYALWGAIGIIMITLFSVVYWKEPINLPTLIGIGFIVIGTVLVNFYGTGH